MLSWPGFSWAIVTTSRIVLAGKEGCASNATGMAAIRRAATGVPLMADESCMSIQDAHAIVAAEAADVLCIKLYKHGGITPARISTPAVRWRT